MMMPRRDISEKNFISWNIFWKEKKILFISSVITTIICAAIFSNFLLYNEERSGPALVDPLFSHFNAIDLNIPVFALIYGCLAYALYYFGRNPQALIITLFAYSFLLIVRMSAMYLIPLHPPEGMIPLEDPVIFFIATGKPVQKDLFFSGHTATLFLFGLCAYTKKQKLLFLLASLCVGTMVVLQKTHYTIDVFTAPFFAYASYKIIKSILKLKA